MSAADRTKRRRAAVELRSKLKSPNFFVSRTRLCLRNLPYTLDEKQLKQLLVAAVRPRPRRCARALGAARARPRC
jgi:nucleolar protein 4